jgi:hypothetical protein
MSWRLAFWLKSDTETREKSMRDKIRLFISEDFLLVKVKENYKIWLIVRKISNSYNLICKNVVLNSWIPKLELS